MEASKLLGNLKYGSMLRREKGKFFLLETPALK
jgi:hypothetical protein